VKAYDNAWKLSPSSTEVTSVVGSVVQPPPVPERFFRVNPIRGQGYVQVLMVQPNERIRLKWLSVFADATASVRLMIGTGNYCATGRTTLTLAHPIGTEKSHTFLEIPLPVGQSLCWHQSGAALVAGDGFAVVEVP
jgi:hypothetical protein